MIRTLAAALLIASPVMANGVEVGDVVDWPMPSILDGISTLPDPEEDGRPHMSLVVRRDKDFNTVVQFSNTGYADDSVEGERVTYVLQLREDGRYNVLETKKEYRCYRGNNSKTWRSELCI